MKDLIAVLMLLSPGVIGPAIVYLLDKAGAKPETVANAVFTVMLVMLVGTVWAVIVAITSLLS